MKTVALILLWFVLAFGLVWHNGQVQGQRDHAYRMQAMTELENRELQKQLDRCRGGYNGFQRPANRR